MNSNLKEWENGRKTNQNEFWNGKMSDLDGKFLTKNDL